MTRPLPASLRAMATGERLPVVWTDNLSGETNRHAVVGASTAEIEIGGVALSAIAEPLRLSPGYAWTLVGPTSDHVLDYGLAEDLCDAKSNAEAAADRLADATIAD